MPSSSRRPATAKIEWRDAKGQGLHEISYVAQASGISAKMIRYYESIGLIPPAKRTEANYRVYNDQDIQMLCLIKKARLLGFSIPQIEMLVGLWKDPSRTSAKVKQLVLTHVTQLEHDIAQMQHMCNTLRFLADDCRGDQGAQCPILEELVQP